MELDFSPLLISLKTSLIAIVFTFVFGIAAAWFFRNFSQKVQWILDVLFTLPLVLPPTVIGFVLLVIFGRSSAFGQLLERVGITIIFTWQATVIAAIVVSFPLMYRAAKGAFEQVDAHMIWAARTLGLSEYRIFIKIVFPLALPGIATGTILAFARALGEFGATLMVAGNIPQVTQTIPLAIYFANAAGKTEIAALWTIIVIGISLVVLGAMHYFGIRGQRWLNRGVRT